MTKVSVSDIKAGMVLGQDLKDVSGRPLLPKGCVLETIHIERLQNWGVFDVDVESLHVSPPRLEDEARIEPKILEWCRAPVESFFSLTDGKHPAMAELHRLALLRTARDLTKGAVMHHLRPDPLEEYAPLTLGDEWETDAPPLARLLENEVELASFPDIYYRIIDALDNPYSSAGQLADVVGKDTALSARLLKLVNSAFFGFISRVDTIERAIALVGTDELTTLALGLSVVHFFRDVPPELIDMKSFWRHSISCGVLAKALAGQQGNLARERFFVAGLLHDIGRLIMFKKLPRSAARAMVLAQSTGVSLAEAERREIGYDHAAVGGLLLQQWKIPPALTAMVRFHHGPEKSPDVREAGVIHLADIMAVAYGIGRVSLEKVPPLNVQAWQALGVSPTALAHVFSTAEEEIEEINRIFLDQVD